VWGKTIYSAVIPWSLPLNPLTLSSRDGSARDRASKNRCTLKNIKPADRCKEPRKSIYESSLRSREDESTVSPCLLITWSLTKNFDAKCRRIVFLAYSLQRFLSKRLFAKEAGFPLFGRTAVRPYMKNMILNGMTDEEDR